jgi:hypothetical protein
MSYPVIVLFYLIYGQRWRAFYYTLAFAASALIFDTLKLDLHCARPYWASSQVQAFSCSSGYGNPSGHAMTTVGRTLLMWLDY